MLQCPPLVIVHKGELDKMTSDWRESIQTAINMFPVFALLMTIPFMVYQYRKYGSIPLMRFLCVYGFSFYLVCAYFLVIFPLPPIESVSQLTTKTFNLQLFKGFDEWAVIDGFNLYEPQSWITFLKNWKGLEPLCNIIMTIPFGVFLHYYFRKSFFVSFICAFGLSLFFEISQLSALFGIYPRPYRMFDVNDLFNNTLGGVIGWIIAPLLCWILPDRKAIDEDAYDHSERVSFPRRGVALVIDRLIFSTIFSLILEFVDIRYEYYVEMLVSIIVFTVIIYVTKGYTIGKMLVEIKLVKSNTGGRPGFFGVLFRMIVIHGVFIGFVYSPDKFLWNQSNPYVSMGIWGCALLLLGVLILDILLNMSEKKRILLYEKITGTKNIEI